MRFDKLTTQFQQAFSDAQSLAVGGDHVERHGLHATRPEQVGGGIEDALTGGGLGSHQAFAPRCFLTLYHMVDSEPEKGPA